MVKIFVSKTVERKFHRGRFLLRVAFVENNKLRLHKGVGGGTQGGNVNRIVSGKEKILQYNFANEYSRQAVDDTTSRRSLINVFRRHRVVFLQIKCYLLRTG